MKKILKISSIALMLISVLACENDDQTIISATGGPELLTPIEGATYVLMPENAASEATTLVWNHADYDVQTAANYEVEVATAGTDFASIISGGTTPNSTRFLVWKVEDLNTIAIAAGIAPFEEGSLDVRIKSSLGTNQELISYSNKITIKVTPYTTESPKLWVPGGYQAASGYGDNWAHSTAPQLASEGFGNEKFEGYVYFATPQDGSIDGEGFKFSSQANWDGTNYGDDGSFSGVLSTSGGNMSIAAGYYRVEADTDALTYKLTNTTWGVIGNATPGGWENSTPMTYDPATKKWTVIVAMTAQTAPDNGWKFRANNGWDINLGDTTVNSTDGTLRYGGDNIGLAASGTYKIELDLSNPRAYKYTITQQ